MPSSETTNLLNTFHLNADPNENDKINSQEVVDYCEARFRVILQSFQKATHDERQGMIKILFRELVFEKYMSVE